MQLLKLLLFSSVVASAALALTRPITLVMAKEPTDALLAELRHAEATGELESFAKRKKLSIDSAGGRLLLIEDKAYDLDWLRVQIRLSRWLGEQSLAHFDPIDLGKIPADLAEAIHRRFREQYPVMALAAEKQLRTAKPVVRIESFLLVQSGPRSGYLNVTRTDQSALKVESAVIPLPTPDEMQRAAERVQAQAGNPRPSFVSITMREPISEPLARAKHIQLVYKRIEEILKGLKEELDAANEGATVRMLAASGRSDAEFRAGIGRPVFQKFASSSATFREAEPRDWGDLARNGIATRLVQRPTIVFAFGGPDAVTRSGNDWSISLDFFELNLGPPSP